MNSDYQTVSHVKPEAHIQTLLDSISETNRILKAKPGQRFQFDLSDDKMCFLLYKGTCHIKRYSDSQLLSTVKAPSIVGLRNIPSRLFIQSSTPVEYIHMPTADFLSHVDKNDHWKPLSFLLIYVNSRFNEFLEQNVAVSAYELTRNLLHMLYTEDFEIRATCSAARYIQDRSKLSRSSIMKILSALNAGGHIVIKRGLLIKINNLPEKY